MSERVSKDQIPGREGEKQEPYLFHVFTGQDQEIVDTMSVDEFNAKPEGDFFPNRGHFTVRLRSKGDETRWIELYAEQRNLAGELAEWRREPDTEASKKEIARIQARLQASKQEMEQIEVKE